LDPDGYYHRLGLPMAASRPDIVAAFRAKARLLHPDVPRTGNAAAFVALKQAYDVLSNQQRRAAYDRMAREAAQRPPQPHMAPGVEPRGEPRVVPEVVIVRRPPVHPGGSVPGRQPRFFDLPIVVWIGLGAFLCLSLYQAVSHLLTPPRTVNDDIRPNAAIVAPLSPSAHQTVLYGAAPVRLAGMPNFYVVPAASPAVLWRLDAEHKTLVPLGQLPPFSVVQAVRLVRQSGMLEVLVNDHGNGFISADHLTPGNAAAARQAYCGYNAGPAPQDGELLERRGAGGGTLEMENRAVEPAVVKLRDPTGAVVLAVFLQPGSHASFEGLPEGTYRTDFAIGELWSRGCNSFAAGMRARRMDGTLRLPGDAHLVVTPEAPGAADIPEQAFERE
jgi:hypothetical protein